MFKKPMAVVQARMSSERLPGKSMALIMGKPMLYHVIDRVMQAHLVGDVVLAFPEDDYRMATEVSDLLQPRHLLCYAGEETDVLLRFAKAAFLHGPPETVVRITGDCPLVDPELIDATIRFFLEGHYEYVYNIPPYPEGLDVEVINFHALVSACLKAWDPYDREHVTPYIAKNPYDSESGRGFKIGQMPKPKGIVFHPPYHFSVDTPEDLEHVRRIFHRTLIKPGILHMTDILKIEEETHGTVKTE